LRRARGARKHYAADRAVAEQVAAAYPGVRAAVRAQRALLARAVRFLVIEAGIRQLLAVTWPSTPGSAGNRNRWAEPSDGSADIG